MSWLGMREKDKGRGAERLVSQKENVGVKVGTAKPSVVCLISIFQSAGYCYTVGSDTAQYKIFRRSTRLWNFEFRQRKSTNIFHEAYLPSLCRPTSLAVYVDFLEGVNFANLAIRSVPCHHTTIKNPRTPCSTVAENDSGVGQILKCEVRSELVA